MKQRVRRTGGATLRNGEVTTHAAVYPSSVLLKGTDHLGLSAATGGFFDSKCFRNLFDSSLWQLPRLRS